MQPQFIQRVRPNVNAGREREAESRAFFEFRGYPDAPAVKLDDSLADGQTDARSRILLPVDLVKNLENSLELFRLDTDAVVLDGKLPAVAVRGRADLNDGRSLPAKLDGVLEEILEELDQLVRTPGIVGMGWTSTRASLSRIAASRLANTSASTACRSTG